MLPCVSMLLVFLVGIYVSDELIGSVLFGSFPSNRLSAGYVNWNIGCMCCGGFVGSLVKCSHSLFGCNDCWWCL